MSVTQTFELNLIPEQAPVVVHCDQYDTGTGRLIVKLFEGDVAYSPTGTATIQGSKPDGHGFSYSATLSGNTVTADLTEQMSCVAGRVRCQIVVDESTGRTGTFVFILEVQPSALPSNVDMSESEYEFIQEAIELTQQAVTDAEGYSEDAEAWAVGERGGVPVDPSDPTYHNNAEYYAQQASQIGSLDDLSDVTITTPSNDQVLKYDSNAGKWVNGSGGGGASTLDDLTDVTITSVTDQQVLTYDSNSGEWINANAQGGVTQLDQLSDVTISAPSDGQTLVYDANSSEWVNGNGGGGSSTLAGLTDVTITSATDGQALIYDANSGDWINETIVTGGMMTDGSNASTNVGMVLTEVFTIGDRTGKSAAGDLAIELGDGANATGYGAIAEGFKDYQSTTGNVSIAANTSTETLKSTVSLSTYPFQAYSLTGAIDPTTIQAVVDGGLDADITITSGDLTARITQDGTDIKVFCTNTGNTSGLLYFGRAARQSTASGQAAHAEGVHSLASGIYSHAEGNGTTASGIAAHAEGKSTTAAGQRSHAEGGNTYTNGSDAHAEGYQTRATGSASHAEGTGTTAAGNNQHVSGTFNVVDNNNDYAVIVGNGTADNARSNILTLDWSGNLETAADVINGNGVSLDGINTATTFAVSLTGWTTDTTSQSGTTLYKKQISLSHLYVDCPSVEVGAGTGYVLPTVAEQTSYDLIQYVTVDDTVPCLYLYASAIPTTAFYINVTGVD